MLKYSVQSRLFAILWMIQTIHKEESMYAVLDKVTIKSEILPCLSTAKRGCKTKSCLIEIINAILYKLKTGCQWEHLPVKALFTETVLSHGAVFHHFNKWRKAGEWKEMWLKLLDKHLRSLICRAWILTAVMPQPYAAERSADIRDGRNAKRPMPCISLTDRGYRLSYQHLKAVSIMTHTI